MTMDFPETCKLKAYISSYIDKIKISPKVTQGCHPAKKQITFSKCKRRNDIFYQRSRLLSSTMA